MAMSASRSEERFDRPYVCQEVGSAPVVSTDCRWMGTATIVLTPRGLRLVSCSSLCEDENRKWLITTRLCTVPDPEIQRDIAILVTVHDALARKHIAEPPTEKRISPSTVIYPAEMAGLTRVLSTRDHRATMSTFSPEGTDRLEVPRSTER
jgi:hypothetical protein